MTRRPRRKILLPLLLLVIFIGSAAGRTLFYHTHISAEGTRIIHSHIFGDRQHQHSDTAIDSIDVLQSTAIDTTSITVAATVTDGYSVELLSGAPISCAPAPEHSGNSLRAPPAH